MVTIYALLVCKIFGLKIQSCKVFCILGELSFRPFFSVPKICNFFINAGLTPLLLNNVKKLLYRTTSLSVTVASVATTFTHTTNNWPSPWWHQTLLLLLDHQRWRPPRRLIPQAANVANPSSSGHQLQPPRPILSPPAKSLQRYPPPPSPSR